MAKVITIFSQKGGVGKTTISINLSAAFALMLAHKNETHPGRVLFIDLDEQAHGALVQSRGFYSDSGKADTSPSDNLAGLLASNSPSPVTSVIKPSRNPKYAAGNLDYIPSSRASMVRVRADLTNAGRDGLFRLAGVLKPIDHLYEYVVIDNPPGLNYLSLNGLICANYVVVLTQLETPSLESLKNSLQTVKEVKEKYNPSLELIGIVPSMCDFRVNEQVVYMNALKEYYGDIVLPHINRRSEIGYAMSESLDIFSYRPSRSKKELLSASLSVQQFAQLANTIRKRIQVEKEDNALI